MLFAKFLSPFARLSLYLYLIEDYPTLLLSNQYQGRCSVNNGVVCVNAIILYYSEFFIPGEIILLPPHLLHRVVSPEVRQSGS